MVLLTKYLVENSVLRTLRLSRNNMNLVSSPEALEAVLRSPACALQLLDLSGNTVCGIRSMSIFDPVAITSLSRSIRDHNRTLLSLDLSCNDIGARGTRKLMDALRVNEQLHTLLLDQCNVTEHGAVHLGEALPHLAGLRKLVVSRCLLGNEGCKVGTSRYHTYRCFAQKDTLRPIVDLGFSS